MTESAPVHRCYVCGSAELAADADPRSPTCAAHRRAREHVVSMRGAPNGDSLAVCQCGWTAQYPRSEPRLMDDALVGHWLSFAGDGR